MAAGDFDQRTGLLQFATDVIRASELGLQRQNPNALLGCLPFDGVYSFFGQLDDTEWDRQPMVTDQALRCPGEHCGRSRKRRVTGSVRLALTIVDASGDEGAMG